MTENLEHGLVLMLMGMGVVFVVLAAIYLGIVILGVMDRLWPAPEKESSSSTPAAARRPATAPSDGVTAGPTEEEKAAIKAALAHHMGVGPDEFDVRFR